MQLTALLPPCRDCPAAGSNEQGERSPANNGPLAADGQLCRLRRRRRCEPAAAAAAPPAAARVRRGTAAALAAAAEAELRLLRQVNAECLDGMLTQDATGFDWQDPAGAVSA